jgi:pimeloyl-ACP methyl ester carboxylesterase
MPTIRVNGTSLYYEEQGAGPSVIFVHGSWGDHGTWAAVVEPLASQFRAVTYDRRGHSRSERSSEQGSAEQDAADLIEQIERLDLAPVFVVGNSSGGLIALRGAATRPDLLRGLSIHEPPGLALLADEPQLRPMLEGNGERISGVRVLLEDGKDAEAAEQFVETVAFGPGMWEQLPPDRQATFVENAPTFLDELRDPDGLNIDLDALSGYAQPTQLTQGDQSPPLFALVLDRLQTVLPHAGRHTYVGAGHIPHITHPTEFAAIVADYAAR